MSRRSVTGHLQLRANGVVDPIPDQMQIFYRTGEVKQ